MTLQILNRCEPLSALGRIGRSVWPDASTSASASASRIGADLVVAPCDAMKLTASPR
jgi:hypothetical protein